jgi:hypothetical protein
VAGCAVTGLSRRRSRVRVPSLPFRFAGILAPVSPPEPPRMVLDEVGGVPILASWWAPLRYGDGPSPGHRWERRRVRQSGRPLHERDDLVGSRHE